MHSCYCCCCNLPGARRWIRRSGTLPPAARLTSQMCGPQRGFDVKALCQQLGLGVGPHFILLGTIHHGRGKLWLLW